MQKYEHFEQLCGAAPMLEVSAAGRINLIGEHVDYCGGKVMPASLNLKSTVLQGATARTSSASMQTISTSRPSSI